MKKWFFLLLLITALTSLFFQSCQSNEKKSAGQNKLKVITTLFPLYDFARAIGREKAEVSLLLPPGVEAHSFEPRPSDITHIQESDIFIFTDKFMEPWVDGLLKGIDTKRFNIVDSSKGVTLIRGGSGHSEGEQGDHKHEAQQGHEHESVGFDPHIWLDFSNAMIMVDNIAAAYIAKDPNNKDFYRNNAKEYKKKLEELDKKYNDTLSRCRNRTVIHAGHFAFSYLAKRYGLKYISVYKGFSPDSEPTPRRLVELTNNIRKYGVKYIYFEELITPKVAEVISKETGCSLLMLHGAHNVTREELASGVKFTSLMERNLENLKVGLQCS
jgi:zinc transport system substrate-binding protein